MSPEPVPRNVRPEVAVPRARVAGLVSRGADPERIEAARAELRETVAEETVRKLVDLAPPLSPASRCRLACLLLSGGGSDAA